MKKVLVLGGYGNFGKRISIGLAKSGIAITIAGRNGKAAQNLAEEINQHYPNAEAHTAVFDIEKELPKQLRLLKPMVVINTCGPFQTKNYSAAICCIESKIHYIDLADGRDFVDSITTLDKKAKDAGVMVISGASTVPGLSSAVLDHYKSLFKSIDSLIYGITPGQKAPVGLATTQSILTYLGKPVKPAPGTTKIRYGWQDIYSQNFPVLGKRWMANCDISDIDLFPEHYNIKEIHFSAGLEISLLHLGLWFLSWVVRLGIPLNLYKHAQFLLKASRWFDPLGTADSGMHMLIKGVDIHGKMKTIKWFIIAKNADGPQIPAVPAIILARKLVSGQLKMVGATPCVGLISLEEYLAELKTFNIKTYENFSDTT